MVTAPSSRPEHLLELAGHLKSSHNNVHSSAASALSELLAKNLPVGMTRPVSLENKNEEINVIRSTSSGIVYGEAATLVNASDNTTTGVLRQFFGIPYGLPPEDSNRFGMARASNYFPTGGTWNATSRIPPCPQNGPHYDNCDENCLTLSVWAPFVCSDSEPLKPVIVAVSGQWLQMGDVRDHQDFWQYPALLGDVIVVSLNDRLGITGFFNGGPSDAPGYVGIYDALTALTATSFMVALGHGSGAYIFSLNLLANVTGGRFFRSFLLHGLSVNSMFPRNDESSGVSLMQHAMPCPVDQQPAIDVTRCLQSKGHSELLDVVNASLPLRFVPSRYRPLLEQVSQTDLWTHLTPLDGVDIAIGYSVPEGKAVFDEYLVPALKFDACTPTSVVYEKSARFYTDVGMNAYNSLSAGTKSFPERPNFEGFRDMLAHFTMTCPSIALPPPRRLKGPRSITTRRSARTTSSSRFFRPEKSLPSRTRGLFFFQDRFCHVPPSTIVILHHLSVFINAAAMQSRHHRSRSKKDTSRGVSREVSQAYLKPWEGRLITTGPKQVKTPTSDVIVVADDEPHQALQSHASVPSVGPPRRVEIPLTASKKSLKNAKKDSAEAAKAGPTRSGTSKHNAVFLVVTDSDHDADRIETPGSKGQLSVRSGTDGNKKTGTPVQQPKHRAPTPGGTPDHLRQQLDVVQPEQATSTQLVTVGGSVMLFLFIFLLAAYLIWPRGSRNPRWKSSGGTSSSGSTSVTEQDPSLCNDAAQLSVWIKSGEILGLQSSRDAAVAGSGKKQVRQFFGIPYGRLKGGDNRFNYSDEFDMPGRFQAFRHGPRCFQLPILESAFDMSEECLTLSIWTPFVCTREESLKTVVVVVSSEWFQTGHTSDHEAACQKMASADLVVVAINFRLGPFGFLQTPLEDMPSNAGFSDLVKALSWIHTNVAAFHGDADAMVALGMGSGGVLLSLDLLAPAFEMVGYFKRLILHGLVAGSLLPRNAGMENARALAANLKECVNVSEVANATAQLRCLQSVSAKALLTASARVWPPFRFVPNLDDKSGSSAAVAPWSSLPLRPLKDVGVLCGYSWKDGRALFEGVIAKSATINEKTPPRAVLAGVAQFFTARSMPNIFDDLPEDAMEALSRPGGSGVVDFVVDAIYYCPLVEMASAIYKMEGQAYVYANVKNNSLRQLMNLSDIIAFAQSGKAPWSAFGASKAVYVGSPHLRRCLELAFRAVQLGAEVVKAFARGPALRQPVHWRFFEAQKLHGQESLTL
ncbi:hypothetical protein HPB52_012815 [Rhipicephalus sanguineus]|uniref:Carboxylesterase type B domain-containing protein n=1 Tax=Rhipicephalus sanguineus TaxID=34632 RepID=A0A9D4PW55_RHISA|nr:hypothetical protein HPB52_012815 [Rhipicephalus sanguineus]